MVQRKKFSRFVFSNIKVNYYYKGQTLPPSREGLSLIYLPKESCLMVFGGISNTRMNDIYIFDLSFPDNLFFFQKIKNLKGAIHGKSRQQMGDNHHLVAIKLCFMKVSF